MRREGTFLHIIITAVVGFVYFMVSETLFGVLTEVLWPPLGIAIYFGLLALAIYFVLYLLNKARGDYRGWSSKNLSSVVSSAFKKGAIALAVLFVLAGGFEFLYEVDYSSVSENASSYVFLIDDSGSMNYEDTGNDREYARITAIEDIMSDKASDIEFCVYKFQTEAQLVREMAPYKENESIRNIKIKDEYGNEILAFDSSDGGTDIIGSLTTVIDDITSGRINAGKSPRILLLSDGEDYGDIDSITKLCNDNNIIVSSIGFCVDSQLLKEISSRTGGTYQEINDASLLSSGMESAFMLDNSRNLLSERVVFDNNGLYLVLRIVFLILLGALFSWIKQKCYCSAYDHSYEDIVFWVSFALCSIAAILLEVLLQYTHVDPWIVRCIFCLLWTTTPGFFVKETIDINVNPYDNGMNGYNFNSYDKIGR